jgi:hypothetical protein
MRQRKEIQKVSRRQLIGASLLFAALASAAASTDDKAVWREFGLADTQTIQQGTHHITAYRMKDPTGALAAWQWQRSANDHACSVSPFCAQNANRTLINEDNYLLAFDGPPPTRAELDATLNALSNKRDSSLPPILTFVPRNGLVPNSSRYILGPESLRAFIPELANTKPGFNESAEAQTAEYEVKDTAGNKARARLAVFYYPTPEMARLHVQEFKRLSNIHIKRSGVLVAMVLAGATDSQADTLLSRIEYEARITLNEEPPPSPIKPLYQLLLNIIIMSGVACVLGLVGGLIYGGMRLYRRRYGNLESEEAMTTLHLTGE